MTLPFHNRSGARVVGALVVLSIALPTGCGGGSEGGDPAAATVASPQAAASEASAGAADEPTDDPGNELTNGESLAPPSLALQGPGTNGEEGFIGVVVTRDAVDVAAESTGRVEEVFVRVGDQVSRGERLAQLDTRELEQNLTIARSSLQAARADVTRIRSQLEEAKTRYERRTSLPDIFSKEELEAAKMEKDTAQATLEAAEARVGEQEAQIEQLQSRLQRAEIRAPFEGTVALRYVDPGATVLAGTPVVRLLSTEELLVRFAVPPEAVESFELGDTVEVKLENTVRRTQATIQHIAPEIDGPSQMVFIEARLEVPEEELARLRSGLPARVFPAG